MRWIGLDVHHTYIQAAELSEAGTVQYYREPTTDTGVEALKQRLGPDAQVALEASVSAFQLHDELANHADRVVVVHPAHMRGASACHVKTDMRDSELLARLLMSGFIHPVWVPPLEYRAIRSLVELRYELTTLHAGMVNRAKASLRDQRLPYPRGLNRGRCFESLWTVRWPNANLEVHADALVDVAHALRQQIECIDVALTAWTESKPEAQLLQSMPGIGVLIAATLLSHIGDVNRFSTPDKLCAYAGVVPNVHASGKTLRVGGLSRGGRRLVKRAVWLATFGLVRGDGRFQSLHQALLLRKPRKVARLAIARRLLVVVWHILRTRKAFRGTPPLTKDAPDAVG
jgi:transposase